MSYPNAPQYNGSDPYSQPTQQWQSPQQPMPYGHQEPMPPSQPPQRGGGWTPQKGGGGRTVATVFFAILGGLFLIGWFGNLLPGNEDDPAAASTPTTQAPADPTPEPTTDDPTDDPTTEDPEPTEAPTPEVASYDDTRTEVESFWSDMDLSAQQDECVTYLDDRTAWLDDFGDEWDRPAVRDFMDDTCAQPEMTPLTLSQESAIGSAESYLSWAGFSREELIDQLEYEQFSSEDAEFAVAYLEANGGVDWFVQAEESAASYMEWANMSAGELYDQLIFEGFTPEQAQHGIEAVGVLMSAPNPYVYNEDLTYQVEQPMPPPMPYVTGEIIPFPRTGPSSTYAQRRAYVVAAQQRAAQQRTVTTNSTGVYSYTWWAGRSGVWSAEYAGTSGRTAVRSAGDSISVG